MSFVRIWFHHPRQLGLRKTLFQMHLWVGVLLSLYLVVIALSGAILVFEDELTSATLPSGLHSCEATRLAPVTRVVNNFRSTYPGAKIDYLVLPTKTIPAFRIQAVDARHREFNLAADLVTGELHLVPRNWLNVVHDLHIYLLLGEAHGAQVNAAGASALLLLAITGLVLWWPGVKVWTRGLRVSFHHSWRRINYDAHSAIGFWTLAIVTWWAFSGMYFGWYRQVAAAVNLVSPLKTMIAPEPPKLVPLPEGTPKATLPEILEAAQKASPEGRLNSLTNATQSEPTVMVMMDRGRTDDFSHRDLVTVDSASGRVLTNWHYGQNQSVGDWILWAMHPLHFGTLWGLPVKVLWFLLGVSLAVLSVTGVLMYWNRYLCKRWRALSQPGKPRDKVEAAAS